MISTAFRRMGIARLADALGIVAISVFVMVSSRGCGTGPSANRARSHPPAPE
jgi:hypothetical protein